MEQEKMESDHGFAENSSTPNAPYEVANQDSIEIPDDSAPIEKLENDEERDDLIIHTHDELIQQSDIIKYAQADIEAIPKTVEVQIESKVTTLVDFL